MLRPGSRLRGPLGRAPRLLPAALAAALLGACGSGSSTGGHDTPQAAASGFLAALGSFDGSAASLQNLLDWVPPSQRSSAQQNFAGLETAGATTRFKVDGLSVGNATTNGDNATVSVQAVLSICVSGTLTAQVSFNTCRPAPISPTGAFDTLTCVRESGQWYVADYSSSATGGGAGSGATGTPAAATETTAASS